jgi:predicted kinase
MNTITITRGLPASGKSTWAREQVLKSNGTTKRINKDDLRAMLDFGVWSKVNERTILEVRDVIIGVLMYSGYDIIVDDTNLVPKHEECIKKLVDNFNFDVGEERYKIKIQDFTHVTPEECIERDRSRLNYVGEKVIRDMHAQYLKLGGANPTQKKRNQNPELPKALIVDLDGTLCRHNGRGPFDYDKCDTDSLNEPVWEFLQTRDEFLIFVSGREDSCREKTVAWLKQHCDLIEHQDYELYMRATGDHRKDTIVKTEIFNHYIDERYYITLVLDDRTSVVANWRDMGLVCWQVNHGDF